MSGIAENEAPVILVVDDDRTNRFVLASMLETRGYRVIEAADGLEALKKAAEVGPALILMDINMPNMTGIEAALRIADLMRDPTPRIVAVTANDTTAQRVECEQAGFCGFIGKPVKMKTLFDVVDSVAPVH